MFGQDLRLERADAVPMDFDFQLSKVPLDRLATGPLREFPLLLPAGSCFS